MTLPSEITDALTTFGRVSRRFHMYHDHPSTTDEIVDAANALDAAILKYGDQRYEEGIEAGRELEQTKMEGM